MGRYSEYFKEIWKLQGNRKVIGLTLFGVVFDNSTPFTPGNQLNVADGVPDAINMLTQKGYDFLVIQGQPSSRTRNLEMQDFENILSSFREFVGSVGGRVVNNYYAPGIDKMDPYVKLQFGRYQ